MDKNHCTIQGDVEGEEDKGEETEKEESRFFCVVKTVWRAFYLTAWVAAAFYSVYNISLFVSRYFERPTQTVITSVKPSHDRLEFPTISICNMNKIEKSFLEVNPTLKKVWERLEATKFVNWKNKTLAEIGSLTYSDIYDKSYSWHRVVEQCKYGGWRDCDELNYHENELFADVVGASGKCYTFNPRGNVFSRTAGDAGCFKFLMNTHSHEYLDSISEVGFVVDIHHHSNYQGGSKIEMSPGYKYRVGIKPKIRKELSYKLGGKCDPKRSDTSYLAYDADSCEYECRDRYINATCGCIISAPPNNRYNYLTCSIRQMEDCGWLAYYHFLTRDENTPQHNEDSDDHGEDEPAGIDDEIELHKKKFSFNKDQDKHTQWGSTSPPPVTSATEASTTVWPTTSAPFFVDSTYLNCSESCPPPCYKRYYEIVVSSSKISTRNAKILVRQVRNERGLAMSAEYLLQNHVLMEFYLADSFTEIISSVPAYSLWHLLSDVGGVMGLFLGASIFSFFAFFKATVLRIYHNSKDPTTFCLFLRNILIST